MAGNVLTLRASEEELAFLQRMVKRGKFRSRSEAVREGLRILREREETSANLVSPTRLRRTSFTIDDLANEFRDAWLTSEDSGEIIESVRER